MANDIQNTESSILLMYMTSNIDALAIGVPALRFLQQRNPESDVEILCHGFGREVFCYAEPEVTRLGLDNGLWPEDFLQAIEAFLGLAETLVAKEYSQIINLDTGFMPCFLARFLKDAGINVSGNMLSKSFDEIVGEIQQQTLSADYVNTQSAYVQSTFFTMTRWFSQWWHSEFLPDGGYPEYYLQKCCGFSIEHLDMSLGARLANKAEAQKTVLLDLQNSDDHYAYPYAQKLEELLKETDMNVVLLNKNNQSLAQNIQVVQEADLIITRSSSGHWLGRAVGIQTLLISGSLEPKILMPDYATDMHEYCPKHHPLAQVKHDKCLCDAPDELATSVASIFE